MYKLRLLANLPIFTDKIPIYSPILKNIADFGKEQYSICLSSCIISRDNIIVKSEKDKDDYDTLLRICLEQGFLMDFLYSLFYFTKLEFKAQKKDRDIVFISGDIELNRHNYNSFINNIKYANCLNVEETGDMDEFDRQCAEMEKKIAQAQNKNQEPVELEDLISAVANMEGNGLSIINIWDLNIYQFYNQLKRGQMKENYFLSIKQLLAGAKPEEVKIESYFKTIK